MGNRPVRAAVRLLLAFVVMAGSIGVSGRPLQASGLCGQGGRASLTLLARPGLGYSFTQVDPDDDFGPYVDDATDRAMVPVRALLAVLSTSPGGVQWNDATRTATFVRGTHTLAFQFPAGHQDTTVAVVDGESRASQAVLCNGKVYAPVRQVAGALGVGIRWYQDRIVVVDPAWDPEPESSARPQVAAPVNTAPPAVTDSEGLGPTLASIEYLRYITAAAEVTPTWTSVQASQAAGGCGSWPENLARMLLAPAETSRSAARAAACQWVRGW